MSTVVLYCWCHSDSASVLLYFTLSNDKGSGSSIKFLHRTFGLDRWTYDSEQKVVSINNIPKIQGFLFRRTFANEAHGHGIGRHTQDEVYQIMREDLNALSIFLGKPSSEFDQC